jgi:hypothetical protein
MPKLDYNEKMSLCPPCYSILVSSPLKLSFFQYLLTMKCCCIELNEVCISFAGSEGRKVRRQTPLTNPIRRVLRSVKETKEKRNRSDYKRRGGLAVA